MSYLEEEGQALLALLNEHPDAVIAVDTETTGLKIAGGDRCIGVSIAGIIDGHAVSHYFALDHPAGGNVSDRTFSMLKWVLEHREAYTLYANVQFDLLSLETVGIYVAELPFIDVISMAHLINENSPQSKSLDSLSAYYLKANKVSDPYVEAEKVSGNQNITAEQMFEYAVVDAQLTFRLWLLLNEKPAWINLPEHVWVEKQKLVRGPLLAMKRRGVRIDTDLAQEYIDRGELEMRKLGEKLGYPAPEKATKANPRRLPVIGSNALKEIFLDRLGLPVVKMTKASARHPEGQPSFDKEAMEEYDLMLERIDSPEAKLIKQYRGWQKAVSAAYRPYIALLDTDGRLRCSYKLHGTVTGRFSCFEPNLQQVPKTSDKEWNGRVKDCFIPQDGYVLINADFSQLELRLATAYSNEETLKQVFLEGRDIFTEMAAELGFERHVTKTMVYSIQYGAGVKRIMAAFGVSKKRAAEMIEHFYSTYPRFRVLNEKTKQKAEREKKIKLWTGRDRHFMFSSDGYKAMNSLIQGGAADVVERIMVRCYEELDSDDCRMLLQVHDSITWEVRADLVDEMIPRIRAVMEDVDAVTAPLDIQLDVKFAVEVDYWTEQEKLRLAA